MGAWRLDISCVYVEISPKAIPECGLVVFRTQNGNTVLDGISLVCAGTTTIANPLIFRRKPWTVALDYIKAQPNNITTASADCFKSFYL